MFLAANSFIFKWEGIALSFEILDFVQLSSTDIRRIYSLLVFPDEWVVRRRHVNLAENLCLKLMEFDLVLLLFLKFFHHLVSFGMESLTHSGRCGPVVQLGEHESLLQFKNLKQEILKFHSLGTSAACVHLSSCWLLKLNCFKFLDCNIAAKL